MTKHTHPDGAPDRRQRGAVLVEFAFVAFLMYLLIAAVIDFGRLFYSYQVAHDAAKVTADELAVIPLPAGYSLDQALADPQVRAQVFQPEHLVIDLDNIPGGLGLRDFMDSLPVLNQMLRPLMIYDRVGGRRLLRYPGALLTSPTTPSGFTVGIPLVEGRAADGTETITWVPIIEEIRNPNFPSESPFSADTPAGMPERGLVRIRINFPFQASMLSGFREAPGGPLAPNVNYRIQANDGGVTQTNAAPGGLIGGSEAGPYAGAYGLGKLYSHAEEVRPFRRLLSVQAIARRQVLDRP